MFANCPCYVHEVCIPPHRARLVFREWHFTRYPSGGCHWHLAAGPARLRGHPPVSLFDRPGVTKGGLLGNLPKPLAEFPRAITWCISPNQQPPQEGRLSLLGRLLDVSSGTPYAQGFLTIQGRCLPPVGNPTPVNALSPPHGEFNFFFLDASLSITVSTCVCSSVYACARVHVCCLNGSHFEDVDNVWKLKPPLVQCPVS